MQGAQSGFELCVHRAALPERFGMIQGVAAAMPLQKTVSLRCATVGRGMVWRLKFSGVAPDRCGADCAGAIGSKLPPTVDRVVMPSADQPVGGGLLPIAPAQAPKSPV